MNITLSWNKQQVCLWISVAGLYTIMTSVFSFIPDSHDQQISQSRPNPCTCLFIQCNLTQPLKGPAITKWRDMPSDVLLYHIQDISYISTKAYDNVIQFYKLLISQFIMVSIQYSLHWIASTPVQLMASTLEHACRGLGRLLRGIIGHHKVE